MTICQFKYDNSTRVGRLEDGFIHEFEVDSTGDFPVLDAIENTDLSIVDRHPRKSVRIVPPIERPGKMLCLGLNYHDHAKKGGYEIPSKPLLFSKAVTAINGPYDDVVYPSSVTKLDYEAELAIVIGKRGDNVDRSNAIEHIAGVTICNDITARDVQYAFSQFFRGKSFDMFAPIGPGIEPINKSEQLEKKVVTYVNEERRQDASTEDMIFRIQEIIEDISSVMTLRRGDIIATGTPQGVGMHREPPQLLSPGDSVRVEIDGIGTIENTIVSELN